MHTVCLIKVQKIMEAAKLVDTFGAVLQLQRKPIMMIYTADFSLIRLNCAVFVLRKIINLESNEAFGKRRDSIFYLENGLR